jgi:hypothetical protein
VVTAQTIESDCWQLSQLRSATTALLRILANQNGVGMANLLEILKIGFIFKVITRLSISTFKLLTEDYNSAKKIGKTKN